MHLEYSIFFICLTTALSYTLKDNHVEDFTLHNSPPRSQNSQPTEKVVPLKTENSHEVQIKHLPEEYNVTIDQNFSIYPKMKNNKVPMPEDIIKAVRKLLSLELNLTKTAFKIFPTLVNTNFEKEVTTKVAKPQQHKSKSKTSWEHEGKLTEISKNGVIENNLTRRREYDVGEPLKPFQSNGYVRISPNSAESIWNATRPFVESSETLQTSSNKSMSLIDSLTKQENLEERSVNSKPVVADSIQLNQFTDNNNAEPKEEDIIEAANFGMQAMNNLYYIKEPDLYTKGLFLGLDDPARYVAAFNDQSEEARRLARFGYAALEGAKLFRQKFSDFSRQSPLNIIPHKSNLHQQCPKRGIPQCTSASLRYRTADGSCNNPNELWWGSAMSTMQRFLPPIYQDGIESIRLSVTGVPLPSAREVSNIIHEDRDIPLASVTHMLMQWGQFIDHDITATGQSRGFNGTVPQCCLNRGAGFQPPEFMHPDCLPIAVNTKDSFYGALGIRCLEFLRSGPAPKEGCEFGPREQLSQVTSYLDASTVYSSNTIQSDRLRLFRNGLLQYGRSQARKSLLPRDNSDLCRRGALSTSCFKAGDGRLSEQPALTSIHIVFLRLHNRIATRLATLNLHWSDEKLFQETRKIVGAIVQHITYREFLPIILGPDVMKIFDLEILRKGYYNGYNPSTNPNVANAFSTAAFRFGHSLVQKSFVRYEKNHCPIFNNVSIHDEFSNPVNLQTAGSLDRIVLGLINQPSQRRDEFIVSELTNHLFQTPAFPFGMDLASLNIQRGRDHGIPSYVTWRIPCGLSPIKSWDDLERMTSPSVVQKFRTIYSSVDDIDLFPAGLAEKPLSGGLVGPTFGCIIAQQFSNLRKGDRFWFENPGKESAFTPLQLQEIRRITLAQVLCRTLDNFDSVQPFVFLVADKMRNQRRSCNDRSLDNLLNLEPWIEVEFLERTTEDKSKDVNNEEVISRTANKNVNKQNLQRFPPARQRPLKTKINQQNRITVTRPLVPHENLTIFVQNNAVNAPIFVNEAHISDSDIQINQPSTSTTKPQRSTPHKPVQASENLNLPVYTPVQIPKPISGPEVGDLNPYMPHNFNDPSNPNPPHYGFNANPPNNYIPNNAYFNSRPNLYKPDMNYPYQQYNLPINVYSNQQMHDLINYNNYQRPSQTNYASLNKPFYGNNIPFFSQNQHNAYDSGPYQPNYWNQQPERPTSSNEGNPNAWINNSAKYNQPSVKHNHYDPTYIHARYSTESYLITTENFMNNNNTPVKVNISNMHTRNVGQSMLHGLNKFDFPLNQEKQIIQVLSLVKDTNTKTNMYKNTSENQNYENVKGKPLKTYNVMIITEANETNNKEVYPGLNIQHEKDDTPVKIRKPGLYYYDRNVLHRYPDKVENSSDLRTMYRHHMALIDKMQTSNCKNGNCENTDLEEGTFIEHDELNMKDSKIETTETSNDRQINMEDSVNNNFSTTATLIIDNNNNSNKEIKSNTNKNEDTTLKINRNVQSENYFDDTFMEIPVMAEDEFPISSELPKPISSDFYFY